MAGFFLSPRIAWGPGATEQLRGLGLRRAGLLLAPAIASLEGPKRVVQHLEEAGTEVVTIGPVGSRASVAEVVDAVSRLSRPPPEAIVAVGGGGLLDTAKGIVARLARPDLELGAINPLTDLDRPERPRLIAVPTTSGSGSEATGQAYLLDADGGTVELSHRALTPEWAFVDPSLLRSVPSDIALDTGFAALGHALEAIGSSWSNPFSDALGRDAALAAFAVLGRLARNPRDEEARTELVYAGTRAGLAAGNAQLGLAHAFARALLPSADLAYARLYAIALPHVIAYTFPSARDRYWGLGEESAGAVRLSLPDRLIALNTLGHIPRSLPQPASARALADRGRILERVQRATATRGSARVPSTGDLERLFAAITGGPVLGDGGGPSG